MVVKRKKKRTVKPIDLPGRWLKSARAYSYIIEVSQRDWREVQLYKLESLMFDFISPTTGKVRHLTVSEKLWTADELHDAGRFLKNPPTKAMIETAKRLPL